jgi:CheY-like chemotaxis protein
MTLVMIVDDVPAMAEQYAYDLKRLGGYEVIAETEGRRALERLGGEAVDCIILDLEAAEDLYHWAEEGVVVEIRG